LVRLIDRSIVRCGDHRRSAGPFWGAGPLARAKVPLPPKGGPGRTFHE